VIDRLYAMRVWSALLLLVSVTATWLLAGELFARNRLLQFGAAAIVGLQPMATFMSSSINPDGLQLALWSLALWLGVRILKRGIAVGSGVALAGVAAATALTKATGLVVLAGAAGVILYALWRSRDRGRRWLARTAVACMLVAVVPLAAWGAVSRLSERPAVAEVPSTTGQTTSVFDLPVSHLGSYLWQFYLPKAGFLRDVGVSKDYGYDVWFRTGWAVFGWKEIRLGDGVYSWLRWLSYATLLAAALALVRRKVRLEPPVAVFLGLTAFALVAGLHWTEFRYLVERGETSLQGRYFLPLLPLAACAGAAALTLVPVRFRGAVLGAALAALVGLQALSLGNVLERYYA
jgi:4-amino-4-deoxy-L-arabinose transferase-like glycosyltransferase